MSDALDNARAALAEPRTGDKHELIGQVATLRSAVRDLIAEHERLTAPPADDERGTPVEGVARAVRDWFAEVSEAAGFRRQGPDTEEWEYAVRQHDGHVWEQDLDDEPWTEASAYQDAPEIRGGHVVRRRKAGPWESVTALSPDGNTGHTDGSTT